MGGKWMVARYSDESSEEWLVEFFDNEADAKKAYLTFSRQGNDAWMGQVLYTSEKK